MGEFKYPLEVFTAQNTKQTLSVASRLFVAKTEDEQHPLKIYHKSFSLYDFSIIEKDKTPKFYSANLNVRELEDMFSRTNYAFNKQMDKECEQQTAASVPAVGGSESNSGLSPAYTTEFKSGPFKGKTPAAVLLDDPQNRQELNQQYILLKKNLGQYPDNQKMLDAIMDAATLLKEGKLKKQQTTGLAYTVQIKSGNYKGKTPAEVLQNDPNGRNGLTSQKAWLQKNLDKYPANQQQIDAIDDALKLFEDGKLAVSENAQSGSFNTSCSIRLYPSTPGGPVPKPLIRNKRDDGMVPVREMEIYWHVGDKYPIEISIVEYYTRVNEHEGGRITITNPGTKPTPKKMRLSEQDWMNCIRSIKADMRNFEMLHAKETRTDAESVDRKNRMAALEDAG